MELPSADVCVEDSACTVLRKHSGRQTGRADAPNSAACWSTHKGGEGDGEVLNLTEAMRLM